MVMLLLSTLFNLGVKPCLTIVSLNPARHRHVQLSEFYMNSWRPHPCPPRSLLCMLVPMVMLTLMLISSKEKRYRCAP